MLKLNKIFNKGCSYMSSMPITSNNQNSTQELSQSRAPKDWRINFLMKNVDSCKAIKELYFEACAARTHGRVGDWTIKIVPPIPGQSPAATLPGRRIIELSDELSPLQQLGVLIFELTNAAKGKMLSKLYHDLGEGIITGEEFTKESERVEHAGAMRYLEIIDRVARENGLVALKNVAEEITEKDFEVWWEKVQKNSDHANFYRQYAKKYFDSYQQVKALKASEEKKE